MLGRPRDGCLNGTSWYGLEPAMTTTPQDSVDDGYSVYDKAITPLMHVQTDWPANLYDLGLGLYLLRPSDAAIQQIQDLSDCLDARLSIFLKPALAECCEWVLITNWFRSATHITLNYGDDDWDVMDNAFGDFSQAIRNAYRESFLTALNLVGPHEAVCPLVVRGKLDVADQSVDLSDWVIDTGLTIYCEDQYGSAHYHESDIALLERIWHRVGEMRCLEEAATSVSKEAFFRRLDRQAGMSAEVKQVLLRDKDREKAEAALKRSIHHQFRNFWYERTFNRTRLGRAIMLYESALTLPEMHGFLSMCIVLETLYGFGDANLKENISRRLSNVLADDDAKRADLEGRCGAVFSARNDLVHGVMWMDKIGECVVRDGHLLAGQSLRQILLDNELFTRFSAVETEDRRHRRYAESLRSFLDHDL